MIELQKEKYKLIYNDNMNNIKTINIDDKEFNHYTVAYTEGLEIIIRIIVLSNICNLLSYDTIKSYKNNEYIILKEYSWDYYIEIKKFRNVYELSDIVEFTKEREFINKNFTKEQRKQISLRIFELFKWWINKYDPAFIIRHLTNKKIKLKRYSIISDYILNNNYIDNSIRYGDCIQFKYTKKEYLNYFSKSTFFIECKGNRDILKRRWNYINSKYNRE